MEETFFFFILFSFFPFVFNLFLDCGWCSISGCTEGNGNGPFTGNVCKGNYSYDQCMSKKKRKRPRNNEKERPKKRKENEKEPSKEKEKEDDEVICSQIL